MKDLKVEIFSDGANVQEMIEADRLGIVDGFTTNPTLMAKAGITDYLGFAREVLEHIKEKSISFEVFSDDLDEMYTQAVTLKELGKNVFVKIPVSNTRQEYTYGLIKRLADEGVNLNITAIFTIDQVEKVIQSLDKDVPAIVSIFAGRIANAGIDPEPIMKHAVNLVKDAPKTKILWASSREVFNIIQAERTGTHIITLTPSLISSMKDLGKDLDEFSLETVKMFYKDAFNAGYKF